MYFVDFEPRSANHRPFLRSFFFQGCFRAVIYFGNALLIKQGDSVPMLPRFRILRAGDTLPRG
ncbi:MAG: hypothetical protein IKW74_02080, partial [Thermoguttaceae bacterium]|nr:hypothetical protein [Thermoguttaceae bacterium]